MLDLVDAPNNLNATQQLPGLRFLVLAGYFLPVQVGKALFRIFFLPINFTISYIFRASQSYVDMRWLGVSVFKGIKLGSFKALC